MSCLIRNSLGEVLLAEGRANEAVEVLESSRDEAGRLRAWSEEVASTVSLSRARLALNDWSGASREARHAAAALRGAFASLGDADIARAQSLTPDVYDLGISASLRSTPSHS